jgi:AcrR family transcriptional regulator
VSDLPDRRARKKALTRAEIRRAAQELFAEHGFDAVTIADIATTADVAVQTVFNHFATKEELFFDGRTPWVDGPAEAVRSRRHDQGPLAALREYMAEWIRAAAGRSGSAERRIYVSTLAASTALRGFELALEHRAEQRLAVALGEAWAATPDAGVEGRDVDIRMAADLAAALWVAGTRTLLVELRRVHEKGADAEAVRTVVVHMGDRLFDRLETGLAALLDLPAPARSVRRAG